MINQVEKDELTKIIISDDSKIISEMSKKYKNERVGEIIVKSIENKKRPPWNNNTTIIKDKLLKCCYPTGNELVSICNCKDCENDQKKGEADFKIMLTNLNDINNMEDLNIFNKKYNNYLHSLLQTKMECIKINCIFRKWNVATTTLLAVNKFKKNISHNNKKLT